MLRTVQALHKCEPLMVPSMHDTWILLLYYDSTLLICKIVDWSSTLLLINYTMTDSLHIDIYMYVLWFCERHECTCVCVYITIDLSSSSTGDHFLQWDLQAVEVGAAPHPSL
ncbi:hypothetical protein I3760_14G043900 [Carya illinoinensis]|nr:hypothetical protein I3760_14G043900 [Carya illinoinensis]